MACGLPARDHDVALSCVPSAENEAQKRGGRPEAREGASRGRRPARKVEKRERERKREREGWKGDGED